ncbi:hypothetical protein ON010_g2854 [Phytophthora cinnamomi]|nr:hypothetical protein ON010_g2854 [Phytophthora cinnamomi]
MSQLHLTAPEFQAVKHLNRLLVGSHRDNTQTRADQNEHCAEHQRVEILLSLDLLEVSGRPQHRHHGWADRTNWEDLVKAKLADGVELATQPNAPQHAADIGRSHDTSRHRALEHEPMEEAQNSAAPGALAIPAAILDAPVLRSPALRPLRTAATTANSLPESCTVRLGLSGSSAGLRGLQRRLDGAVDSDGRQHEADAQQAGPGHARNRRRHAEQPQSRDAVAQRDVGGVPEHEAHAQAERVDHRGDQQVGDGEQRTAQEPLGEREHTRLGELRPVVAEQAPGDAHHQDARALQRTGS